MITILLMREIFIVVTRYLPKPMSTHQRGFTLIELLITLIVLGVIVSIAAPSMSNQLATQRSKQTAYELYNALKEAKTDASIERQNKSYTIANAKKNASTSITPTTPTSLTFRQNGYVSSPSSTVTLKVCDTSQTTAMGYSVVVTPVGNISINSGVSCP